MRLGTTEIILIVVLALVLFGGGKLAGVGKALGKSIKDFKNEGRQGGGKVQRGQKGRNMKQKQTTPAEETEDKRPNETPDGDSSDEESSDGLREAGESMLSHLMALRKVLLISAAAVLIGFVLVFYLAIDPLMAQILAPIQARGIQVIFTTMSEALVTKFKVALLAGMIIASPVVIWEIWGFIKPALYPQEKRKFRLLFVLALLLFLTGVVFCYFAVYSLAVDFFLVAGDSLATPMLSIDKYVSFLFGFLVPFGVAFQLPVVLYLTTRVGLTTPDMLRSKRKYVILAIFVLAAILTPPDVVSQVALGLPMCGLYEIGILVSRCTKARERA